MASSTRYCYAVALIRTPSSNCITKHCKFIPEALPHTEVINKYAHAVLQVDVDGSGHVSAEEMMQLPQLQFNPLAERVVAASFADRKKQGEADRERLAVFGSSADLVATMGRGAGTSKEDELHFRDFVMVLSPFAPGASAEKKLRLAFAVYDLDGDGMLGHDDLTQLLRKLLPDGTEEELLDYVVKEALEEADQDDDGFLSYPEFLQAVRHSDLKAKLTINFQ